MKKEKKRKTKKQGKRWREAREGHRKRDAGSRRKNEVREESSGGETRGMLQLMLVFQPSNEEQMELRRCVQGHVH